LIHPERHGFLVRMARGSELAKTTQKTAPSLKTKTQPDAERDGFYEGPDPITWLHIVGTAVFLELPRKKAVTLGSSSKNDIVIKAPYISRRHCTLTRLYDGVRVDDHSKNGTWVNHRSAREAPKEVSPGQTFVAGRVSFLALNDEMHASFPILSEILDWEEADPFTPFEPGWPMPSNVVVWGAGTDHLLVLGPRGCGQEQLAETIHAISPMRDRKIVWANSLPRDRAGQKDLLLRAQKTTLVLTIDDKTAASERGFVSMVFSPSYRIRVLVCAPSIDRVQAVLGAEYTSMRRVELRALAFRTDQLVRIFDRRLEEIGSPLRFDQLTKVNRDALMRCEWRRNLDDLRVAAQRLDAVERTGSLRKAALALGIKNFNVMQNWYTDTMKLTLPLTAE